MTKREKVKKAVIPVAGLGTRMWPATKAIPKEMLPLVDKPLIQFVVKECVAAGINNIIFVTHSSKNAIENHFDMSFGVETLLEKHVNKKKLFSKIQTICPKHVTIMQVRQGLSKGLGNAILCAHPLVGDEPIAVMLPDVIIDEYQSSPYTDNLAAMLEHFSKTGHSQILVNPIKDVKNYGIVDCQGIDLKPGDNAKIVGVVEKPTENDAPSNLSVVGRYVLSSDIWEILKTTAPLVGHDNGHEVQLTNAIARLIEKKIVEAYRLKGCSYDCGNKLGYMQAFFEYSLRHENLGEEFQIWLKETMI